MRLAEQGKVIIEVGLNETFDKDLNPNIPYGPEEVAASAIEAARAGAAIIHFHSRAADGAQDWLNEDTYVTAAQLIAAESDVLLYGSFQPGEGRSDYDQRAQAEMAPIDFGSLNVVGWDGDTGRLLVGDVMNVPLDLVENRPNTLHEMCRSATERGLHPSIACFEPGWLRHTLHVARAGLLASPLFLKFPFSERWLHGLSPRPQGIDVYLDEIPSDVDYEAIVLPYLMDSAETCEQLWRHALARGMGLRTGIGDSPHAFRKETNADLVHHLCDLIAEADRDPATPDDVRARFGIRGRAEPGGS